jgi:hypothetical protein
MMTEYYIEFNAWYDGDIVAFKNVVLDTINLYRSRKTHALIDPAVVKGIFISFNEAACTKFLENNVLGKLVGIVIPARDKDDAIRILNQEMGYCEVVGICDYIDQKDRIDKMIGGK